MKTLHRLMYENLTPEEYKEFCKCNKLEPDWLKNDCSYHKPSRVINKCMYWDDQPQEHGYWETVYCRLRKLNK